MSDFHLVAFVLVRDDEGRLLLMRRAGVSYAPGQWGLPGGHVETTESLAEAAAREVWEEVGLRIDVADLTPVGMIRYVDPDMVGLDVYFTATRVVGEPRPVSECDAVGWYAVDALPPDVLPWLPGALSRLLDEQEWFTDLVGVALPD